MILSHRDHRGCVRGRQSWARMTPVLSLTVPNSSRLVRASRPARRVSACRLVPLHGRSFPFGVPACLAIIGRRQGFFPRHREGRAEEELRTEVMLTAVLALGPARARAERAGARL